VNIVPSSHESIAKDPVAKIVVSGKAEGACL